MKTKVIILRLISFIGVSCAFAQVEQDDMYFNSKDRAKLRAAQKANEVTYASAVKKEKKSAVAEEEFNPTDSYSARNVNPEYTSRSQSQTAKTSDEDYFVNNYQYASSPAYNSNNYNNWNNNFNNWYGNSWYRPNYYGSINAWNSPYGAYNSMNSPWYDPYWSNSGYSSSFSCYYGNSWNYSNPYYNGFNSYYGLNSYYGGYGSGFGYGMGMGFGYGSGWYGNNYGGGYYGGYPGSVVIINNGENSGGRSVVNGKRPTRSGSMMSGSNNNSRSRSTVVSTPSGRDVSNGRVSTSQNQTTEYYNRSWRNNSSNSSNNAPASNRSSTQQNRPSSWSNSSNTNSWNNSNTNDSNRSFERSTTPSYTPSRSSSSDSGGGSRSQSSSSGSGSNGRSRGRD